MLRARHVEKATVRLRFSVETRGKAETTLLRTVNTQEPSRRTDPSTGMAKGLVVGLERRMAQETATRLATVTAAERAPTVAPEASPTREEVRHPERGQQEAAGMAPR